MTSPKVTVLMPVYNAARYLRESIDSVLAQSFRDFELLVVNDGSTDGTREMLGHYRDSRLRVIENKKNLGLSPSLNLGLKLARTDLVARMDHDDVCDRTRLEKQVAFMLARPEIGVCGTWYRSFGNGPPRTVRLPLEPAVLHASLLFECPLAHPTVMLRRKLLVDMGIEYDSDYQHAEDYDLWSRMAKFTKLANIPHALIYYRIHSVQVSSIHANSQKANSARVRLRLLREIGLVPSALEQATHEQFGTLRFKASWENVQKAREWLNKVIQSNQASRAFDEDALKQVIARRWIHLCNSSASLGPKIWLQGISMPGQGSRSFISTFSALLLARSLLKPLRNRLLKIT